MMKHSKHNKIRNSLVCFMAVPITRKLTVILMVMKIWINSATHEKRLYFCVMICGAAQSLVRFQLPTSRIQF